jgi:hypothetical protein
MRIAGLALDLLTHTVIAAAIIAAGTGIAILQFVAHTIPTDPQDPGLIERIIYNRIYLPILTCAAGAATIGLILQTAKSLLVSCGRGAFSNTHPISPHIDRVLNYSV